MEPASLRLDHWPNMVGHIATVMDLEASAGRDKALRRRRGVRGADALLHLALLYGRGGWCPTFIGTEGIMTPQNDPSPLLP